MQNLLFIDGRFVPAVDRGEIEVLNPADGSSITRIAAAEAADVDLAVAAARRAFPAWAGLPAAERGRLLLKLADAIEANAEQLARLESLDTGHPLRDSRNLDVPRTAACFRYFGGIADKLEGKVIPVDTGFLNYVQRKPIGVVGQIVPWNFPLMFTSWKLGPALAAGNTVVLKPSEITPLSTLRIAELIQEVGFPDGVVNIVPGYGSTAGQRLAEHPDVGKIAFTGSTLTGQRIVEASRGNLKRVQLELGGKGANIVFDDADLDAAVEGALISKYRNNGQTCVCANRLYVQDGVYDAFVDKLKAAVAKLNIGNGLEAGVTTGPLIDAKAVAKVEEHIADAVSKGAKVVSGGKPHALGGTFFEPTILVDVPKNALVSKDETFGPLAPVFRFKDEAEVIAMSNDTEFGLASYFYARDLARVFRVAEQLEYGMVGINTGLISNEVAPFGGIKASGLGREGSKYGIEDYLELKYLCLGGI